MGIAKCDLMDLARSAVKQSGLSMFEIAHRAGLSYSRVHDLVKGRTKAAKADTLNKIFAACGADVKLVWKTRQHGRGSKERRKGK